jgi:hypothetical protein
VVGLAPAPWAPGVEAFLAIGQGIQLAGVLTALIAGVLATRANDRTSTQTRR